jgi:hypothetical protein
MDTNKGFNYTNIVGKGCEGWLNLFFKDYIIQLIRDVDVAEDIRGHIPERIKAETNGN